MDMRQELDKMKKALHTQYHQKSSFIMPLPYYKNFKLEMNKVFTRLCMAKVKMSYSKQMQRDQWQQAMFQQDEWYYINSISSYLIK